MAFKFLRFLNRNYPKLLSIIFFIALFGAYLKIFAIGQPYGPGATLDPLCAPGELNCFVQIIPDQTSHSGDFLTTDGTITSWSNINNTYFKQGGNSFGGIATLGTNDNNALTFETNNTENARITDSGNFLIGHNTDNGFKLDVDGTVHLNDRLYIGPLPENYSPAFINVSSFADKDSFVNSVFSLSSTETGSPTYPTQLIYAQEGASVGWSFSSVNQGVSFTPIILNPYGGGVLIHTKVNNNAGALQVGGNNVPSTSNSYSLGTSSYRWLNIYSDQGNFSGSINVGGNISNSTSPLVLQTHPSNGLIRIGDYNDLNNSTLFTVDDANSRFIFEAGNVTIGSNTATALFNVGSSAQFRVNSSGAIAAATGITSSGTITFSGISGSTQCLQVNSSGVVSGTGSACGGGGGGITGSGTDLQLALWNGTSSVTGLDKYTYATSSSYPNITIGSGSSVTYGASLSLRDVVGTYMHITSDGGPLSLLGSSTYKRVQITPYAGAANAVDVYRPTSYNLIGLHGLVSNDETTILSNTQGVFDIARIYAYQISGNNPHGFTDQTIFRQGNSAFNSFGSFVTFGNTNPTDQDHYAAFQNVWTKDGSNTMGKVYGFVNAVSEIKAGTITDLYGYYHYSPTITGGTITNQYGIYIPAVTGATNNYGGYFGSNVGIGDSTPDYLFDVENTGSDTNIFSLTDSDGSCLHNPEAGGETVSCSSDERLKTNIVDATSALEYFSSFKIREYNIISSGDKMIGVIAQEVLETNPELVSIGSNELYQVKLPNTWQIVKAVQELNLKVQGLSSLDVNNQNSIAYLVKQFIGNVGNTISDIYAGIIHSDKIETKNLCVGNVCVTEEQFLEMVNKTVTNQNIQIGTEPEVIPNTIENISNNPPENNNETQTESVQNTEPEIVDQSTPTNSQEILGENIEDNTQTQ